MQLHRPLFGPAATGSHEPLLAFSDGPLLQMVADSNGSPAGLREFNLDAVDQSLDTAAFIRLPVAMGLNRERRSDAPTSLPFTLVYGTPPQLARTKRLPHSLHLAEQIEQLLRGRRQ